MGTKTTKTAKTAKAKRVALPRKAIVLIGTSPANKLTAIASVLKDGRARTQLVHRTGEAKPLRGMIEFHADFAAACTRLDELAASAAKKGWKAKEKKSRAKTPTFTEIPSAS